MQVSTYTQWLSVNGNTIVVGNSLLGKTVLSENDSGYTAEFAAGVVTELNLIDGADFAAKVFLMRKKGQSWSRMDKNNC